MVPAVWTSRIRPTRASSTREEGPVGNPVYRQIAEDLRGQIESGGLAPGQQLRTETELGKRYGASRNTVRDAIKWLISLGLVETRPGQGTFVVKKMDPFITILTGDPSRAGASENTRYGSDVNRDRVASTSATIQVEIQESSEDVASSLQIAPGTE